MLQELLDKAVDEVFGQYDETGMIQTCAVATMSDGARKIIPLSFSGGVAGIGKAFRQADAALEAAGTHIGTSITHLFDQDKELVFISVRRGNERGISALGLNRGTGISINDFTLLTGVDDLNGGSALHFIEPSDWCGKKSRISIRLILLRTLFCSTPKGLREAISLQTTTIEWTTEE